MCILKMCCNKFFFCGGRGVGEGLFGQGLFGMRRIWLTRNTHGFGNLSAGKLCAACQARAVALEVWFKCSVQAILWSVLSSLHISLIFGVCGFGLEILFPPVISFLKEGEHKHNSLEICTLMKGVLNNPYVLFLEKRRPYRCCWSWS